jgi:hypothetical protein
MLGPYGMCSLAVLEMFSADKIALDLAEKCYKIIK